VRRCGCLELRHQRREKHARAAEKRAEREARREQTAGVQVGQPLKQAEQEHVSGKIGSHVLRGYIVTHVHTSEAKGDQKDSQCFTIYSLISYGSSGLAALLIPAVIL
jgi:hypothetical protein